MLYQRAEYFPVCYLPFTPTFCFYFSLYNILMKISRALKHYKYKTPWKYLFLGKQTTSIMN